MKLKNAQALFSSSEVLIILLACVTYVIYDLSYSFWFLTSYLIFNLFLTRIDLTDLWDNYDDYVNRNPKVLFSAGLWIDIKDAVLIPYQLIFICENSTNKLVVRPAVWDSENSVFDSPSGWFEPKEVTHVMILNKEMHDFNLPDGLIK